MTATTFFKPWHRQRNSRRESILELNHAHFRAVAAVTANGGRRVGRVRSVRRGRLIGRGRC